NRVPVRGQHQRVAIWCGLGDPGGARKTGPVLDDGLLLPQLAKLVGEDAGQPVGDAAGGEWNDDTDNLVGISLRRGLKRGAENRRHQSRPHERGHAQDRHHIPPTIVGAPIQWVAASWKAIKAGSELRVYEKTSPSRRLPRSLLAMPTVNGSVRGLSESFDGY